MNESNKKFEQMIGGHAPEISSQKLDDLQSRLISLQNEYNLSAHPDEKQLLKKQIDTIQNNINAVIQARNSFEAKQRIGEVEADEGVGSGNII